MAAVRVLYSRDSNAYVLSCIVAFRCYSIGAWGGALAASSGKCLCVVNFVFDAYWRDLCLALQSPSVQVSVGSSL
jgi:hypothetical protein